MTTETTLVIGATGKTGQRVLEQLDQMGVATRGVSRSSSTPFDWYDSRTWSTALEGITQAYVAFQPDLAVPVAESIIKEFIAHAKAMGLRKIVLLSGRGEEGAERAEQILISSGLDWNIVRASWFSQNFSEGFMLEGILSEEMVLPESSVQEPFIDVDDIAEVAVAALTQSMLNNRLFEVTGPRLMTFAECINEINEATGKNIQLKLVSVDEYVDYLRLGGLPEDIQWLMRELFSVVFDGRNASTAKGVEDALGRNATDFKAYIQKVIARGTWSDSQASI